MSFNPQEFHESFMAGFAEVEARRLWEKEYIEEHGIVIEREKTPYERMEEAGLFDYGQKKGAK
jgi:hypothetical protein